MRTWTSLTVCRKAETMQDENFPYAPSGAEEVNKMIKEHGDLFSDSQCKICSAVLISESQKLTHYQSKKHANKVRRYFSNQNEPQIASKKSKMSSSENEGCNNGDTDRTKVCDLCNMTFSSPVMAESHYQGKVHAKNLRLKTVGPSTQASQTAPTSEQKKKFVGSSSGGEGNDDPDRFCSMCKASFNNPIMAQQHYDGKKHRKQMTKVKLLETYGPSTTPASTLKGYPCTLCKIELNSVDQYQSHITGAKHKNQMKKSGLSPGDNQQAAEQPHGGNDQYPAGDDQYAAEDEQFAAGDGQYTTGGDDYNAEDNQYAADDVNYSQEYQYT